MAHFSTSCGKAAATVAGSWDLLAFCTDLLHSADCFDKYPRALTICSQIGGTDVSGIRQASCVMLRSNAHIARHMPENARSDKLARMRNGSHVSSSQHHMHCPELSLSLGARITTINLGNIGRSFEKLTGAATIACASALTFCRTHDD